MTTPDHPLPSEGGSYIRNPDGSLTRVPDPVEEATEPDSPPVAVTPAEKPPTAPRRGGPIKEN